MLQASTIKFLKDLKKNNNKPWFEKNKPAYLDAKGDMDQFVQKVIDGLGKIDADVAPLQSKDCQYRIYRDVRFSKDKTPYKSHMGAFLNKGGKKSPTAGYYFHCEPGRNIVGGGLWMPMPPELSKVRQEIDYNFPEWKKIVNNSTFKKLYPEGLNKEDILSRPPKGYDEENPAIEFLKLKSFFSSRTLSDAEMQSKSAVKEIVRSFQAMKGFIHFFNHAIQ